MAVLPLALFALAVGTAQATGKKQHGVPKVDPLYCQVSQPVPELVTNIKTSPSYFFKPIPNRNYLTYISGSNKMIKMDNAETIIDVPGGVDPVPTPDGRFLTNPGMVFYSMTEVLAHEVKGQHTNTGGIQQKSTDSSQSGVYQSIGVVPNQPGTVYRVMTENANGAQASGLIMRDYKVTGSPPDEKVTGDGDSKTVCPGRELKLPMISKTGEEMAAYDLSTRTTRLFKLAADGSCTPVVDLGVATGKVDFSFDGTKIAFQVDTYNSSEEGGWFSGVSSMLTKNVVVVNLDRSNGGMKAVGMTRVTAHTEKGEGSYYPGFRADGKLVYVTARKNSAADDGKSFSFSLIDLNQANYSPYLFGSDSCVNDKELASFYALGSMWGQLCTKYMADTRGSDSAFFALSADPAACKRLVEDYWSKMKARIVGDDRIVKTGRVTQAALDGLSESDLVKACPKPSTHPAYYRMAGQPVGTQLTGTTVYEGHCRECHEPGSANGHIDFQHLTLDRIDEMLDRMNSSVPSERMPANQAFGKEEKKALSDYLKAKRKEIVDQAGGN